jgi:glycerophosphoryl diester phosphodiesterase
MNTPWPWPYPRRIAHRGAGLLAPENTLAALRLGAEHGYTMFEFDVKLSADGVAVLMHDATLARTAGLEGCVADRSWADLAHCDVGSWHSPRYAGEGIPTLARVGRWLHANRFYANIEIKPCPGREVETAARIVEYLDHHWPKAMVPPLLSSFSEAALAQALALAPHWPRALLLKELPADWLDRCSRLACVAVDPHHRSLDAEVVQQAHRAGLRVLTYTVNDPQRVSELDAMGVDAVITDALDILSPA